MCRACRLRSLGQLRPCRTARTGQLAAGCRCWSRLGSRCAPRMARRSPSSPSALPKRSPDSSTTRPPTAPTTHRAAHLRAKEKDWMPDVKHMKWWGWGIEGGSFHHENKPGFRPFVINAIDLDVNAIPVAPMSLQDLPIPAPMISDQLLGELRDAVGSDNAVQDDLDRIVHTYGKRATDLLRIRAGDIPRVPDVVVYPGNEAEVQHIVDHAVAADAVIIPYGGGTSFSGSLRAPEGETRPVISVDLGRMNQLIDIDEESGLARIQAGALGPDLEDQLSARGWVLGHYPDSFTHSTLGGWVATRSSGMQSDKYGDISDITRGMRVVMPDKVLVVRPVPQLYAELGVRGWIMCHLSHSYHSGVCLYFTFGFKHDGVDPLGQYEPLKNAIQQAFVDSGGTLSHHHPAG